MPVRLSMSRLNSKLQSPRLILRTPEIADAAALYQFHLDNKSHFSPWDPPYPKSFFSEDYWAAYAERAQLEFEKGISGRYILWMGNEIAGSVNATSFEFGPYQNARLGYKVGAKFQGQGLAREGVAAVVDELFRVGFHRVEANYRTNNLRSGNLLKSLGFVAIGIAPHYLLIDGAWREHMLTAITVENWK